MVSLISVDAYVGHPSSLFIFQFLKNVWPRQSKFSSIYTYSFIYYSQPRTITHKLYFLCRPYLLWNMAFHSSHSNILCFSAFLLLFGAAFAQLSTDYYSSTCPKALSTIKTAVNNAVYKERRMGASLLRLHFHDCFVNACFLSLSLSLSCTMVMKFFYKCLHIYIQPKINQTHYPMMFYTINKQTNMHVQF